MNRSSQVDEKEEKEEKGTRGGKRLRTVEEVKGEWVRRHPASVAERVLGSDILTHHLLPFTGPVPLAYLSRATREGVQ